MVVVVVIVIVAVLIVVILGVRGRGDASKKKERDHLRRIRGGIGGMPEEGRQPGGIKDMDKESQPASKQRLLILVSIKLPEYHTKLILTPRRMVAAQGQVRCTAVMGNKHPSPNEKDLLELRGTLPASQCYIT